jgi:16S rRNA U1498 N3-methylase RsmE
MDLTLAEFACFNLRSKQQILNYKAMHISSLMLENGDNLMLYAMNGQFITMQLNRATDRAVRIDSVVQKEMIHLFADKIDISGLLN